ncbi:MAG: hypothetical protein LBG24_00060 [Treponema sp.]|jgi:hypothetical protein|nr:hypothetical protein [Treponema sp.]
MFKTQHVFEVNRSQRHMTIRTIRSRTGKLLIHCRKIRLGKKSVRILNRCYAGKPELCGL